MTTCEGCKRGLTLKDGWHVVGGPPWIRHSECTVDGDYDNIPVVTLDQYRGARLVHRFFPMHWARVQLARATAERYPRIYNDR